MLLTEIVRKVLERIIEVAQRAEGSLKDKDHLLYFESQLAYAQLKQLLKKYSQSNEIADSQSLEPFCEFLSERWKRIQNTDAIYSHRYQSHINQVCISLATIISNITHTPINKLLMPTLNMINPDELTLNKVVLSDDNSRFIDVCQCLELAHEKFDARLKHTYPANGSLTPLTEGERLRVVKHSQYSQRYYKDILEKRENSLERDKIQFVKTLGDSPLSTYGEQGWNLLENNIFSEIQTREQLVNIMLKLKRSDWEKFLAHIPIQKLNKIVLDGKTALVVSQDIHSYIGEEEYDRVISFLIVDNYRKGLNMRVEEYTGLFGSWTGYSKEQKKDASLILYNYLRSDAEESKLENLSEYLKKEEFKPHLGPLTSTWHTLGKLTKQILSLGNAEYRKELQNHHKQEQLKRQETIEPPKYYWGFNRMLKNN